MRIPASFAPVLTLVCCCTMTAVTQDWLLPQRVSIVPVFYVPADQKVPEKDRSSLLLRHIRWTQQRYSEVLPGRITFAIAEGEPRIYRSPNDLSFYEAEPDSTASRITGSLLDAYGYTRYSCPFIFLVIVICPDYDFPVGGGRPFNGGYNTGGGIIHISSYVLDNIPNVQSTLEHEIGHAIGLPHVDVYGYDMGSNASMMSYNLEHRTRYFEPGEDPAIFIPEDIRGLALNDRVLPDLAFDHDRDVPAEYQLYPRVIHLGPMEITGHPFGIQVATPSGETWGSRVSNTVQGRIDPSERTGTITYNGNTMWTSGEADTGWVTLDMTMPFEVRLTAIRVHSEHSGLYHRAIAGKMSVWTPSGARRDLAASSFTGNDETVTFEPTTARQWRIDLRAGSSKMVVVRGIQFYDGEEEIFPPLVPVGLSSESR